MRVTIHLERDTDGGWVARVPQWHIHGRYGHGRSVRVAINRAVANVLLSLVGRVRRGQEEYPPRRIDLSVRIPSAERRPDAEKFDPELLRLLRERSHGPTIPFEQVAKEMFGPRWRSILRRPKRKPSKRARRR